MPRNLNEIVRSWIWLRAYIMWCVKQDFPLFALKSSKHFWAPHTACSNTLFVSLKGRHFLLYICAFQASLQSCESEIHQGMHHLPTMLTSHNLYSVPHIQKKNKKKNKQGRHAPLCLIQRYFLLQWKVNDNPAEQSPLKLRKPFIPSPPPNPPLQSTFSLSPLSLLYVT
jgi:hypothetical protein